VLAEKCKKMKSAIGTIQNRMKILLTQIFERVVGSSKEGHRVVLEKVFAILDDGLDGEKQQSVRNLGFVSHFSQKKDEIRSLILTKNSRC